MDIFSGNGFTLSYNPDTDNQSPKAVTNIKINEIAAMPTLQISSKTNSLETYDSEFNTKLLAEQNVSNIDIVVNYIPNDPTHIYLDEKTQSHEEFQIVLNYKETDGKITYAILNGAISSSSLNGDKDSVVQKMYAFTPTEVVARSTSTDALLPLYQGDYGVGSNGTNVPQYDTDEPTGNAFSKITQGNKIIPLVLI